MDLRQCNWRGLSLLFAAYNIVAGAIWILRAGFTSPALIALGLHLVLAGLLVTAARSLTSDRPVPHLSLALLVPWILWLLSWGEIGWLYETASPVYHDPAVMRWDLAVFGTHWNDSLSSLLPGRFWWESLTGVYLSYYLLILGPPLVLVLLRRWDTLFNHTFGLMLTYLGCFTIYLILPVQGPRDVALAAGGLSAAEFQGFFPPLMDAIFRSGDSLGTAFPSSHCAGATAAALLCRRHFSGRTGLACGVWATLIVISTIHTNNHYAIDALAGIGLATLACLREVRREKSTGYRRHRIYRTATRLASHSAGPEAPGSGAQST